MPDRAEVGSWGGSPERTTRTSPLLEANSTVLDFNDVGDNVDAKLKLSRKTGNPRAKAPSQFGSCGLRGAQDFERRRRVLWLHFTGRAGLLSDRHVDRDRHARA